MSPSEAWAQQLLAEAAWLRRLVRTLVQGDDAVDDVCQETMLATWRRPRPIAGNLRAWLAHVARAFAARAYVRQERRRRREAAAARPEAEPATDALVERFHLQQRVAAAVDALPEPYRRTVLLRWFEELPPRAIAARLGEPVETVRTRLKRALAMLRARLDAEHGGRAAWAAPFAAWRGAAGLLTGSMLMGTKVKLAFGVAAAALLMVAAWQLWTGTTVPPDGATSGRSGPLSAALPSTAAAAPNDASDRAALHHEAVAREPRAGAALLVRAVWHDGAPAAGVGFTVEQAGGPPLGVLGTTGADGTARIDGLAAGRAFVRGDRNAHGEITLATGATREVVLRVPRGISVDGVVVDAVGNPVGGAEVLLSCAGLEPQVTHVAARTGGDGAFALRDLTGHGIVGARARGHGTSAFELLAGTRATAGDRVPLRLVLPGRGATVAGRVLGPDGAAVAGAHVRLGEPAHDLSPSAAGVAHAPPPPHVTTDAEGRFVVAELPPGAVAVRAWAPHLAPCERRLEVADGQRLEVVLQLPAPATLTGTIRQADGAPAADVTVELEQYDVLGPRPVRTAADGSFRLQGLPPGTHAVHADGRTRGRAATKVRVEGGLETRWDATLDSGHRIDGTLLDHRGEPLAGWRVLAAGHDRAARTDAHGKFALSNLAEAGPHRLLVYEQWPFAPALLVQDDVATGTQVLRVPEHARRTGTLTIVVRDPEGGSVPEAAVSVWQAGRPVLEHPAIDATTGAFTTRALPPGTYSLHVTARGFGDADVEDVVLLPGETKDLGEVRLQRR